MNSNFSLDCELENKSLNMPMSLYVYYNVSRYQNILILSYRNEILEQVGSSSPYPIKIKVIQIHSHQYRPRNIDVGKV